MYEVVKKRAKLVQRIMLGVMVAWHVGCVVILMGKLQNVPELFSLQQLGGKGCVDDRICGPVDTQGQSQLKLEDRCKKVPWTHPEHNTVCHIYRTVFAGVTHFRNSCVQVIDTAVGYCGCRN